LASLKNKLSPKKIVLSCDSFAIATKKQ